MAARAEITVKYARAYAKASKKDKGRLLDEVVAVTGPRSSLRALRSADWRAVTNSFGVRVRALPSSPARKEA